MKRDDYAIRLGNSIGSEAVMRDLHKKEKQNNTQ